MKDNAIASTSRHVSSNGITLDEIVSRLKKAKPDGKGGFTALCPAHDDHNPSLSIRRGDKQGVIIKCHSQNCTYHDVVGALGLSVTSAKSSDMQPTYYEYRDESGVVAFRAVRKYGINGDKTFSMQTPDGRGGWISKLPREVRRVPYRLPELIEAIAEEKRIYVVEGEKDCDTAREYGLVATTNIGGAGKWGEELSAHLKDADVVILPDNDAPGRDHAERVARSLAGIARSIRIVTLPGLLEKGDLTDWLCEGHQLDELERCVTAAPVWTGNEAPDNELPFATCALYAPPPEPLTYVVDEMFVAGEPGMIFGDGGSFKTTGALHIACAIAGGYKAFAHFGTVQRPVLIVSAEDSAGVLTQRMTAMCNGHGWDVKRVLSNVHYYALGGVTLTDPKWCTKILAEIVRLDAGFVMLDPYQELVPGVDQNSAEANGPHMATLRRFCQPTKAAVVLLHHAGKAGENKRAIDRVRGSSALYGAMRLVYLITDSSKDSQLTIECLKNNRAEKLPPFAVRRVIDSEPSNRLHWVSARFDHITIRQADFDKAQTFVLEQIDASGRVSTTDLKNAAKGTGVNAIAMSGAIRTLETLGVIDFEEAERGKKLWGRKEADDLAEENRATSATSQLILPGNVAPCPATCPDAACTLPTPIGGRQAGILSANRASTNETPEAA
jgi:hypothetical protein